MKYTHSEINTRTHKLVQLPGLQQGAALTDLLKAKRVISVSG